MADIIKLKQTRSKVSQTVANTQPGDDDSEVDEEHVQGWVGL